MQWVHWEWGRFIYRYVKWKITLYDCIAPHFPFISYFSNTKKWKSHQNIVLFCIVLHAYMYIYLYRLLPAQTSLCTQVIFAHRNIVIAFLNVIYVSMLLKSISHDEGNAVSLCFAVNYISR